MQEQLIKRAKELLADGTVQKVVGWQKGLFDEDVTPAVFASAEELDKGFVFNKYCAANLSKYLVRITREIEIKKSTTRMNNTMAKQRDPNAAEAPIPQEVVLAYLFSLNQMILIHLQSFLKKTALPATMFMQSEFLARILLTAEQYAIHAKAKNTFLVTNFLV